MKTFFAVLYIIASISVLLVGGVLIYGAIKRWKVLLELPANFYPLNILQRVFGTKFLMVYYIVIGTTFIIAGIAMMVFLLAG